MRAFPFRVCVWTVIGAASVVMGCTEYKPGTDMPALKGADSGPFLSSSEGPDWSCLEQPAGPAQQLGRVGDYIVYSVQITDLSTRALILDVDVRACSLTDVDCKEPVVPVVQRPNSDGWVNLPLRNNFQGYLELKSPGELPQLFHVPDSGLRTMRDYPIVMISEDVYVALVTTLKLTPDSTLGGVAVRTFDCKDALAEGVAIKSDMVGAPWYWANGAPSTALQATDSQGLGGFVGIAPGFALSRATLPDGTEITGQTLLVRGGWMSTGFLRPPQAIALP
jgi:hypothetical protein